MSGIPAVGGAGFSPAGMAALSWSAGVGAAASGQAAAVPAGPGAAANQALAGLTAIGGQPLSQLLITAQSADRMDVFTAALIGLLLSHRDEKCEKSNWLALLAGLAALG